MRLCFYSTALLASAVLAQAATRAEDEPLLVPSLPEQQLRSHLEPEYPTAALERHIQGVVRFRAVIAKDGRVENLRLISGHPLLVRAARQAVLQWIYRPVLVNGKPVRVRTEIQVYFNLDPSGKPVKKDAVIPLAYFFFAPSLSV